MSGIRNLSILCIMILCSAASGGKSSVFQPAEPENPVIETVLPNDTRTGTVSDSLYDALRQKYEYGMLRDKALWRYLARDYLSAFPIPAPSGIDSIRGEPDLLIQTNGVPFVRRVVIEGDSLLVAIHQKENGSQLVVSYWTGSDSGWIQRGKTFAFETNEDPEGSVFFVGDSGQKSIAIGAYRGMFGVYRLGYDSMPCLYAETLTTDTARYVGFYQGEHAGRFGCIAAETRKIGTGGWERLFLYHFDGDTCRKIPIPGIGTDAIKKNHISECQWLEPGDTIPPPYAELLIARQYIEQSLSARVYRFDGTAWKPVSQLHTQSIVKLVHDQRCRDMHRLLYDTNFAASWMTRNADTIRAHADRIRMYGYKLSHSGYISKLFPAGLYYFSRGEWDSAFAMMRMLHTPWGARDNHDLVAAEYLETITSLLVSCGDLTCCSFADSLYAVIRYIKKSPMGDSIGEIPNIDHGPLPNERLTAFVDSLWPLALDETRNLRLYRMHGKEIIMAERTMHDSLANLAERMKRHHVEAAASRFWNTLRQWYTGVDMQFFLFAEKNAGIRSAFHEYADTAVMRLMQDAKQEGAATLPSDIIHGVLLNYCRPEHHVFCDSLRPSYASALSFENARMLTYALSLGDSAALLQMQSYLSLNDSDVDTFVFRLFNPLWSAGPIASACTFGFETVWKLRPTVETLVNLAPGLVNGIIVDHGQQQVDNVRHILDLIESDPVPELRYLFMMLFHAETMKALHGTGLYTDRILRDAGLKTDTLYEIVNEIIMQGEKTDGFDIRDVIDGLEHDGRDFVNWAIASGMFEKDRKHWIELMMLCGLDGYDSLMHPFALAADGSPKYLNRTDICYLLKYGSKKSRTALLKRYTDDKLFSDVAPFFRLSMMRSGKKIRRIIDSLPLYDPDTLTSEHWRMVDWSPNDYLMLVPNKRLNSYKWRYLYVFDSFSNAWAAKTWYYDVLVNEFQDLHDKNTIIARVEKNNVPWEFGYDIMRMDDLRELAGTMATEQSDSEFGLYWEKPLMEQVLARRLLRRTDFQCLLRFMPNYTTDFVMFLKK